MNHIIQRIQQMEQYFDTVLAMRAHTPDTYLKNPAVRDALQQLIAYQESGLWLQDYDRDSRGELPRDLKRGVLSQDALYDLLQDLGL